MIAIRAIFDGKAFVPQQPVKLPSQSEALILVETNDSQDLASLDQEIRSYYQSGSGSDDQAWGNAVAVTSHKTWDED